MSYSTIALILHELPLLQLRVTLSHGKGFHLSILWLEFDQLQSTSKSHKGRIRQEFMSVLYRFFFVCVYFYLWNIVGIFPSFLCLSGYFHFLLYIVFKVNLNPTNDYFLCCRENFEMLKKKWGQNFVGPTSSVGDQAALRPLLHGGSIRVF